MQCESVNVALLSLLGHFLETVAAVLLYSFQGLFFFLTCSTFCHRAHRRTLSSGCTVTGSRLSRGSSPTSQVTGGYSSRTHRDPWIVRQERAGRGTPWMFWRQEGSSIDVPLSLQALICWGWAGRIWFRSAARQTVFASSIPWKEGEITNTSLWIGQSNIFPVWKLRRCFNIVSRSRVNLVILCFAHSELFLVILRILFREQKN